MASRFVSERGAGSARALIPIAALLALVSCSSPLDVPTQRIDTTLTNRIKLRDILVNVRINRPTYSLTIDDWPHTIDFLTFQADTANLPPHISMNCILESDPKGITDEAFLKRVHIRLDDLPAEGTISVVGDPLVGTGASATVVVNGVEYNTSKDYVATGVLYHIPGRPQQIQGTIAIGLNCGPDIRVAIAVNFLASQS